MGGLALRLAALLAVVAAAGALLLAGGRGGGGDTRTAQAASPRPPHAILIVLDELPGDSLLGPGGRIDAERYPSFAALAASGTWFRNAYSVYDSTTKAVPLILDGLRPARGRVSDATGHPHTVFDMFGRRGYRVVASEEATAVCPRRWCANAPARRPAILPRLSHGRDERLERFVAGIRPSRRPTFWMKHVLLPHGPWIYLPSGLRTRAGGPDPLPGMGTVPGFHDEFLTRHNEQRYLLQLGFVDRMLGRLLRRLRESGMFDRTLIVVTADHGFAWQVGVETRRSVGDGNIHELAPVPLIVKAPGQRRGRVSDVLASTLDVAPTIADVLGMRLPYRADGRSAFGAAVRARRTLRVPKRDFSRTFEISTARWEGRRRAVVRRRLRQFGSGTHGLYTGIGPNRSLLGRDPATLPAAAPSAVRAELRDPARLGAVRRGSGIVPAQIVGELHGGRGGERRDLALAVNGRVEAVGRSFQLRGTRAELFALMVPESSLREGRNRVELFEVVGGRRLRLLTRA